MSDWWSADPIASGAASAPMAGAWWKNDPIAKPAGADAGAGQAFAGGVIGGVPILGPLIKGGAQRAAAGIASAISGRPYADTLAAVQKNAAATEEAHPIAQTAGEITGGVASTGGLATTSLGARLLGLTAKTLPRQMVASGLSGAALNAADAEVRGNDPTTGAEIGGALGALGPVAGRVAGAVAQGAGRLIRGGTPPAVPSNVFNVAGVDVPVSTGQATGDVATQMMENSALRGGEGQAPQRVAEQFFRGEQAPAVEQARANIGEGFGGGLGNVIDNPQEAGQLIGEGVRSAEQASRQGYQGLYNQALSQPGEIHASAFEGIGQKIKGALSLRQNPVIIDDVTTPIASRAIQDIDNNISQLKIQNRADPFGQPNPENVTGINLQGVDQVRKRLTAFASATERGSADQRAMRSVINEFDNNVEGAISNGLFTGDDAALDALKQARAAYSQHQQLFRSQGAGDDVGRAMERIVGRNGGEGATPTEVANYLYGASKVGASGLSVRLAQRMQQVLGEDSPEWAALRQGLWSRLSQATEGTTEMGPQKLAGRINEFLNGSGAPLAQTVFSPAERGLMRQFAALQQQLTPKPGTVNYSNTAPVLRMLTTNTLKGISLALGGAAAGPAGMIASYGVNRGGQALVERSAAGRVARSLYRSPAENAAEDAFVRQMGNYGALAARLVPPTAQQPQQQAQ